MRYETGSWDRGQNKHVCYLDVARVGHEVEGLVLVPFGELATAEDEAELLAVGQLGRERLRKRPGGGEGVVVDLLVRLEVGELRRPPANGPADIPSDAPRALY